MQVDPAAFESDSLDAFRKIYPNGRNFLVTPAVTTAFEKMHRDLKVEYCSPSALG